MRRKCDEHYTSSGTGAMFMIVLFAIILLALGFMYDNRRQSELEKPDVKTMKTKQIKAEDYLMVNGHQYFWITNWHPRILHDPDCPKCIERMKNMIREK